MDSTRTCFICTGFNLDLATLSKEWESNESKMAFLNRLRKVSPSSSLLTLFLS